MKSDSQLMLELSQKSDILRVLSPEESAQLKSTLLEIYKAFAAVCERHGLVQMLSGGSCLGAVRHSGFIPWDDDLDVMMPRSDYQRFIELCEAGEMGSEYEFDYPNPRKDAKTVFLKIFKKGTLNVEIFDQQANYPKGIYIDVFALDSVPKRRIAQRIKGLFANGLQFLSILTRYAKYPSPTLKMLMAQDKGALRRYKTKVFLGRVASIIPHRLWVWWFDRFVSGSKPNRPVGIPTGRKYYNGEIFPQGVFFPPQKATFEGVEVNIPANHDAYLKNLYRNYMQLPPVEKRERHFIIDFKA